VSPRSASEAGGRTTLRAGQLGHNADANKRKQAPLTENAYEKRTDGGRNVGKKSRTREKSVGGPTGAVGKGGYDLDRVWEKRANPAAQAARYMEKGGHGIDVSTTPRATDSWRKKLQQMEKYPSKGEEK